MQHIHGILLTSEKFEGSNAIVSIHPIIMSLTSNRNIFVVLIKLKVICTIFDIGAQNDSNIFQTLTVLLFFHLSQK